MRAEPLPAVYVLRSYASESSSTSSSSWYNLVGVYATYKAAARDRAKRLGRQNAHLARYWPIDKWDVQR